MYQGQKEQPMPGAYYGPPVVPPPQQQQHHHHRSRRGFSCLFGTAVAVMVLLVVLALVLWLALRPSDVKVYVTSASLTRFNLTAPLGGNNRNLEYNLTTVVSIRNPNRRVGLYYDWLEAAAFYEGERFAWTPLPTFYQGHKNTTTLFPAFAGTAAIDLGDSDVADFERERQGGYFDVVIRLRGGVRFRVGSLKTRRTTMKIRCFLTVPYAREGGATGRRFGETRCHVH